MQFQFGSSHTPAKVSFFAPVTRADFVAALTAVYPGSSDFGGVEVDGEVFAITDKFINSVLMANADKTYKLIGKKGITFYMWLVYFEVIRASGSESSHVEGFDPSEVKIRLERMWNLTANFGQETDGMRPFG